MRTAIATLVVLVAGCQAEASLRSWSLPTEQDNASITRAMINGRVSFVIQATTHLFVMSYDGTNWVAAATLNHPGSGSLSVVEDTDIVLNPSTNRVDFYRIVRTGETFSWSIVGTATVSAASSPDLVVPCASTNAAICLKPSEQQVWFVRIDTSPVQLDIPSSASLSAKYVALSNSFLATWESGSFLEARRYDASTGSILASNHWAAVGWGNYFLKADGLYVWISASNILTQYSPESLTAIRTISLPDCSGIINLASMGSNHVVLANASDGSHILTRIDIEGNRIYSAATALTGLDWVAPDGIMALNRCNPSNNANDDSARVLRLTDGVMLTHDLFSDSGPDSGQAIARVGATYFGAKACFWWDGVEIREIDPSLGPWQGPLPFDPWPFSLQTDRLSVFPITSIGSTSSVSIVISNSYDYDCQAALLVKGPGDAPVPFRISQSLINVPATGTAEVVVMYAPTNSEPSYANVQIFRQSDTSFSIASLAGRTTRNPILPANVVTQLEGYARSQANYLTNAATINVACGWPRSWYSASHSNEGYAVMHEVGLADLCRAVAAERGWLPVATAWQLIEKSLGTMEIIQGKTNEFPDGSFYRYYWIRNPDGSDLLPDQVIHDPNTDNHPSSDDNGLLVHSLLLVRTLAGDQQYPQIVSQIDRILHRLNLHRFVTPDGNAIAMWRDSSGTYSPLPNWDTVGTEGTPIAAALFAMNQLTISEYTNIIDHMANSPGWYRNYYVPYGDYSAPVFVRIVRSLSGLPVSPEDAQGSTYWMSCVPLVQAQLAWADESGCETILSHVMSQKVAGVPQTGVAAGNTQGVEPSGQSRSGPHAWFIPFARPQWLDTQSMNRLLAMMNAYEPLYFSAYLGWECAVPFSSSPPHQGTDAGSSSERVYEMLNTAYILTSVYDALRISEGATPLSGRHPLAFAMSEEMGYADVKTPIDVPPIRITAIAQQGSSASLSFESLGQGLTNFAMQRAFGLPGSFTNQPGVVMSNRWGGVYDAASSQTNPRSFFRLTSP